jgi:hypothetical protein
MFETKVEEAYNMVRSNVLYDTLLMRDGEAKFVLARSVCMNENMWNV